MPLSAESADSPNSTPTPLRTDAVMAEVRARVREELGARVSDPALAAELERLFLQATTIEDPARLVLPSLLTEPWRPELALSITSHRDGWIGNAIVAVKRRVLLPLTRFLFEYTLGNFRRQDRVNLAVLACLEQLAAENLRLRRELELAAGGPERDGRGASADDGRLETDRSRGQHGERATLPPSA